MVFKTDIALPQIKEFKGKAKFLPDSVSSMSKELGYIVHVVVPPLDLKKVPEKYLKDKPVKIEGVKTVRPPIEQVYYEVVLSFNIKDKDGFTIAELTSPSEVIVSGKDNVLQNVMPKMIADDIAERAKAISVKLTLNKCNTCEDE